MRLPLPILPSSPRRSRCAGGPRGVGEEGTVTYRCPSNDYTNTITAKEAERLGCKKLEGAPVTVIQMTKPRPPARRPPAAAPAAARHRRRSGGAARARQRRPPHPRERAADRGRPPGGAEEGIQQRPARAAGQRAELPEVRRPGRRAQRRDRPQGRRHRRHQARAAEAAAPPPPCRCDRRAARLSRRRPAPTTRPATRRSTCWPRWSPWSRPTGECMFANSAFENALGLSRRSMSARLGLRLVRRPAAARETVAAVAHNDFATSRLEAQLRRPGATHGETLPVHVIVNQIDGSRNVVFEMVEIEQQTRQEREERALEPGAGHQGADPQPRARDQEPARRHPRRGAAAARWRSSRAS